MKGFSIIIPTLNRTAFLFNTINDLIKQEFALPFEIIIVDQSLKEDLIIKKLADDKNIHYHYITIFRGLPEARNYGASVAKYDYLLFVDDDIQCGRNLLEEHYKYLVKSTIKMVAGGISEVSDSSQLKQTGVFEKLTATPVSGFNNKTNKFVDHVKGCNFSIKKNVYIENNGIDENLTIGAALYEELDLCLRVNKNNSSIYFNSDAHLNHLVAPAGGCRVPEIKKYIYALSRNRSIIIKRHLPWYYRITAHIYLMRLIFAYMISYKSLDLLRVYSKGFNESCRVGKIQVKNSFL